MGALLRLVFAILIVAVIVGFFMGYRIRDGRIVDPSGAVAARGELGHVDPAKAREAGATNRLSPISGEGSGKGILTVIFLPLP